MRYFDHDTGAWKDDKIGALCYDGGLAAYGLYFVVLELIYEEEGPVNLASTEPLTKSVARWFGIKPEEVAALVNAMCGCGLLVRQRGKKGSLIVFSNRAEENIKRYQERCETARRNGKKGGRKSNVNQTANQVGSDSLSKSGGKEKKRKETVSVVNKSLPNTGTEDGADAETAPDLGEEHCYLPSCPNCGGKVAASVRCGRFAWVCPNCGVVEGVQTKDFGVVQSA